jgi:hypothetical protein
MRMRRKREAQHVGNYTVQLLDIHPVRNGAMVAEPEFIRYPKPGHRCLLTGLSRTTLAELVDSGEVSAAKIRKKGSLRAITLIHRESLLSYLRSQMQVETKAVLSTPADKKEGERPGKKEDEREAGSARVLRGSPAATNNPEDHQKSRRIMSVPTVTGPPKRGGSPREASKDYRQHISAVRLKSQELRSTVERK